MVLEPFKSGRLGKVALHSDSISMLPKRETLSGTPLKPCSGTSLKPSSGMLLILQKPCSSMWLKPCSGMWLKSSRTPLKLCSGMLLRPCSGMWLKPCSGKPLKPCSGMPLKPYSGMSLKAALPTSIYVETFGHTLVFPYSLGWIAKTLRHCSQSQTGIRTTNVINVRYALGHT